MTDQPTPTRDPLRRLGRLVLAVILVGLLLGTVLMLILIIGGVAVVMGGTQPATGNLAVVRVEGVITAGQGGGLLGGEAGAERIVEQLRRAAKDSKIKAIVLRINSPGGSAAGSQEIYQEVQRARARKPVITSMGDVAASGGYYAASATNLIVADPATLTGSIGVIWTQTDLSQLLHTVGIRPQVVKSGPYKDISSPFRPITPQERQILQGVIDNVYAQFVKAVAQGRGIPETQVRRIADGRVFTGQQALQLRLVDQLGGFRDAVELAARQGGISGEPKPVEMRPRGLLDFLTGSGPGSSARLLEDAAVSALSRRLAGSGPVIR